MRHRILKRIKSVVLKTIHKRFSKKLLKQFGCNGVFAFDPKSKQWLFSFSKDKLLSSKLKFVFRMANLSILSAPK